MKINSEIQTLEELVGELSFQSTILLKKLNDTELEKFSIILDNVANTINENAQNLSKKDIENLEKNLNNFGKILKDVSEGIQSVSFTNFDLSVKKFENVESRISALWNTIISTHNNIDSTNKKIIEYSDSLHVDFVNFQEKIQQYLNVSSTTLELHSQKLENIDFKSLRNRVRAEINSIFCKNIQELSKNNELAKKLSEKNILAIEKHNKSIKTINFKIILAACFVAFFLGVFSITIFQVDILKKAILFKKLRNLEQTKIAIQELKEEKDAIAKKYKLSEKVKQLLENNVELVVGKNEKYVVVRKQNTKKVYISKQGHGVIFLK